MKRSNIFLIWMILLSIIRYFFHPEWTSLEMISGTIFLIGLFGLELLEEIKEKGKSNTT